MGIRVPRPLLSSAHTKARSSGCALREHRPAPDITHSGITHTPNPGSQCVHAMPAPHTPDLAAVPNTPSLTKLGGHRDRRRERGCPGTHMGRRRHSESRGSGATPMTAGAGQGQRG